MTRKARQGGHIDIYLGAKIKERRRLLGLTLEDLAEALGLTYQQVQKYEKGVNRVTVSRLCDISLALKTPIGFFLQGLSSDLPHDHNSPPISKDAAQLVEFYTQIKNPILKRQLVKMALSMSEAADEYALITDRSSSPKNLIYGLTVMAWSWTSQDLGSPRIMLLLKPSTAGSGKYV